MSIINWELEHSGRKAKEKEAKNLTFSHFSCDGSLAPGVLNAPGWFKKYRFKLPTEDSV